MEHRVRSRSPGCQASATPTRGPPATKASGPVRRGVRYWMV
ncbi:Hypothetical protein AA314_08961 [Archangium gephyra]|uniref:Uncharacterized protein n=1 Tax=Archangium gephyra TaxID=48 RepID=A0AAC8TIY5_9BACT|nr:Hypothetical protein AA314_08961 [Archangium gephyra]